MESLKLRLNRHFVNKSDFRNIVIINHGQFVNLLSPISVPPLPPTNLQVSGISNRTATLTWQAPVVTFLNSLTAVSSFQVMATQEQFSNVSDIYVNVSVGVTTYTFPQTLEEYTVYTCTVKARNAFGLGNATHPVTLRTLQTGMYTSC